MEISVDQMYSIENRGHEMGFLKQFMMENAGAAAVRRLVERIGSPASKKVLILAGLGNNGGDGLVMARHLAGRGAAVTAMLLGDPADIRTEECAWNWAMLGKMPSVRLVHGGFENPDYKADVIVDGILGTGITGQIREPYSGAIRYINGCGCHKLAVDVPSGLDPQTGQAADPCVTADTTVTFHRMKQGIPARPDLTGDVFVEMIGIPPEAEEGIL